MGAAARGAPKKTEKNKTQNRAVCPAANNTKPMADDRGCVPESKTCFSFLSWVSSQAERRSRPHRVGLFRDAEREPALSVSMATAEWDGVPLNPETYVHPVLSNGLSSSFIISLPSFMTVTSLFIFPSLVPEHCSLAQDRRQRGR
jgi:hypothetical protein